MSRLLRLRTRDVVSNPIGCANLWKSSSLQSRGKQKSVLEGAPEIQARERVETRRALEVLYVTFTRSLTAGN
jgi:hypothetical protein